MIIDGTEKNAGARLTGFVPYRLDIAGRPELSRFPCTVLFAKQKSEDGRLVSGFAPYEPDFKSLRCSGTTLSMRYRNGYGGDSSLLIEYDILSGRYTGQKFVRGELVGMADGIEWDLFFFHLTLLGLTPGERCLFNPPESAPPQGVE